jgi:glucan biosynthesis protein C
MEGSTKRYHGLDALRALAMIMGVVLHASMVYVEGIGAELGYELSGRKQIPTSETLGLLFFFIHTWRMPVFFLLAGFFARLIVQKRGVGNLLKNRFIRIVIPLVAGVFVYNLVFGFGALSKLHHLWFLYDLVWMYILLVCMKYVVHIWPNGPARIDWFFGSTTRLWWLMILLLPATIIGRPMLFNWIHTDLGVPGPFFIVGFAYVFIGWFIHRNTQILTELAARWKPYFVLGIIGFGVLVLTLTSASSSDLNEEKAGLFWLVGLIISPFTTLLITMGFIGGSEAIFQRSNKLISYFVDASYWIYLLHLVVVFAIGATILKKTSLEPIIAVLINIIITTAICIATYHIFVRYTPVGWVLHGKRGRAANSFKPLPKSDL